MSSREKAIEHLMGFLKYMESGTREYNMVRAIVVSWKKMSDEEFDEISEAL